MTRDVIALTSKAPDVRALLAGLYAGGPDVRLDSGSEGAAVRLCAPDGRPLVNVEAPLFLQVPGEVRRLFGQHVPAEEPVWWTEVRGSTAVEEAGRLAGSVAGRLVAVLGGTTWPSESAHTDVVNVPSGGHRSDREQPLAADVLTDRAMVVFQDRPFLAATTWFTDLLQTSMSSGREVQCVTPSDTRLTQPARALLTRLPARWVVRVPEGGYYDGLSGAVLHWHDGHFTPKRAADGGPQLAEEFTHPQAAAAERQLLVDIRTNHPATEHLLLGGALEACWQTLTDAPPAGWSTAEPVNIPWSSGQLTELARTRAQKSTPTWLVAVGAPDRPGIATLHITHTPSGIEEHITLALGYDADEAPPLDALPELAEILATRHQLTSMLACVRQARADLTTPPRRERLPIPVSFTLGPDAVRVFGRTRAESAGDARPTRLGPAVRPALHYTLGNGTDPAAWRRLKQLGDHLKAR
ncbi:DUF6177 family protein [Streptomyces sp. MB09-02B]|uniref:DUF6177 family protein n=1 Tax=Streptomyces sp. MB09-02B TaxID=3028667 RepID=UPI0029A01135|nr:DUF6177 family protein [Streptomyces sp. MB09-02B]MDX3645061.1 DUF6177 family protein [Streptomyces sp. MB09-02B]